MGNSGAKIDASRTKAAEALADKNRENLAKIQFSGKLVFAKQGSNEYHAIRSNTFAFNDGGYPIAIFAPESAEDVSKIVKGLNGLGLNVAVAGGKHSPMAMPDGAVVIDLDRIRKIDVNIENRFVDCGGGCRIADIDNKLSELKCGLGFVTGTNGDTGVAGLTLLGGWGFLARKYGLAVDNLIEAEVVLADGSIIVCDDQNEDKMLMRALRGGGGNFGIVTRLRLKLHDVSKMYGGGIIRLCPTLSSAKQVLQQFRDLNKTAPINAGSAMGIPTGLPIVAHVLTYCADKDEPTPKSAADLPYFKDVCNIKGQWLNVQTDLRVMDYHKGCQKMLEDRQLRGFAQPAGYWIKDLTDEMIDVVLHFTKVDYVNRKSAIVVAVMGGNTVKGFPVQHPHALSHREAGYWIILEPKMKDNSPGELARHLDWTTRFKDAIRKVDQNIPQAAHYFFDSAAGQEKNNVVIYSGEHKQFLRESKSKYDPSNFFHMNSNILPLTS